MKQKKSNNKKSKNNNNKKNTKVKNNKNNKIDNQENIIKSTNNKKKLIIELIIIYIITLTFNLTCLELQLDEIWNYGFAHNLATGLIPYQDFNMIVPPLYPFLGSIFLYIFGDTLVSFHIFVALICTLIYYYMKKMAPGIHYLAYELLLFFLQPSYNLFCLLLLFILMNLEDRKEKKYNDYLIGIILGLTFLTKQNIGIYLCIPTLFTKDIKKIFKRILGFLMPNIIFLIYLLITNTLYEFIDYAFLGISSFTKENGGIQYIFLIVVIIALIFLIYKYIKIKDLKVIYLICFMGMAFPILEAYHVIPTIVPVLCYLIPDVKIFKKILCLSFIISTILVFSINIYLYNSGDFKYPNDTTVYKYRKMTNTTVLALEECVEYINNTEGKVYIINMDAYYVKLETQKPITKYDLLNNGNFGKEGPTKIIEELENTCSKEKCTFLLNPLEIQNKGNSQTSKEIIDYVIENYQAKESIVNLLVFRNY